MLESDVDYVSETEEISKFANDVSNRIVTNTVEGVAAEDQNIGVKNSGKQTKTTK